VSDPLLYSPVILLDHVTKTRPRRRGISWRRCITNRATSRGSWSACLKTPALSVFHSTRKVRIPNADMQSSLAQVFSGAGEGLVLKGERP